MADTIEVHTLKGYQNYKFFPVSSGWVEFEVKAPFDVHVILTKTPETSNPNVAFWIGCLDNTTNYLTRNSDTNNKVILSKSNLLSRDEFRGFWISWDACVFSIGREGEVCPFMTWTDPEPFPVNYFGVCTFKTNGYYKIKGEPKGGNGKWVHAAGGKVPPGAVVGGHDCNGEPLYIARAKHEGATIPGKLVASHRGAYVAWGGGEHYKVHYQVLVGGPNNWIPTNGSNIPTNAFQGGETEDGKPLYIGRFKLENSLTVGKVHKSHGACYTSFSGQEIGVAEYEVLVP